MAKATDDCWEVIQRKDLSAFAAAYQALFDAQTAMFSGMVHPTVNGQFCSEANV